MQEGYLSAQHIVLTLRGKWDVRMTFWLAGRRYLLRRDDRDGPKSGIGRSTSDVHFADVAYQCLHVRRPATNVHADGWRANFRRSGELP